MEQMLAEYHGFTVENIKFNIDKNYSCDAANIKDKCYSVIADD